MKPRHLILTILLLTPVCMIAQNRYDIVIDEIMADPTPQIGLPGNEWIELKNTSVLPINLQGWRIGDASSQSGAMPNFVLQPDSFVIVCTSSAVAAMSAFGTTISVTSFPSLDNGGDQLFLKSNSGKIIHAVSYTDSWYKNEVKKDG
ncbi:MAG: lamin tail domain-containing protein, partial [Bacteroidetes bacterium]|nr:lamin tail domain-containing protein [Bacteroidota bacterium]